MKENDIGGTGSIFDQVINANILIGKKGRPWCSPSIRRSSEELNFIEWCNMKNNATEITWKNNFISFLTLLFPLHFFLLLILLLFHCLVHFLHHLKLSLFSIFFSSCIPPLPSSPPSPTFFTAASFVHLFSCCFLLLLYHLLGFFPLFSHFSILLNTLTRTILKGIYGRILLKWVFNI